MLIATVVLAMGANTRRHYLVEYTPQFSGLYSTKARWRVSPALYRRIDRGAC